MILFIHTADKEKVYIGLISRGDFIAEKRFKAQYKQAEKLLPEIEKLLTIKSLQLKAITAIAVIIGPGPFTALRIGVITANTLSYVLGIPVVGLNLTQYNDGKDIAKKVIAQLKKTEKDKIVFPFYGKEPNITVSGTFLEKVPPKSRASG